MCMRQCENVPKRLRLYLCACANACEHVRRYDLLLFTPAYLVNCLEKFNVPLGSLPGVSMIVLDEAHHTVKVHPFTCLMDDYVIGAGIRTLGIAPRPNRDYFNIVLRLQCMI